MSLFSNIRFYVLVFNISFAIFIWFINDGNILRVVRHYALASLAMLYFALLASPLIRVWPTFPLRADYIKARRAIGVSAFMYGALHATLAFFNLIGGFEGFFASTLATQGLLLLGATSLLILTLMAATSTDWAVAKLGFLRWKALHKLVYYVAVAITIHAVFLGTHFQDKTNPIALFFITLGSILLVLEVLRFIKYLQAKQSEQIASSQAPRNDIK